MEACRRHPHCSYKPLSQLSLARFTQSLPYVWCQLATISLVTLLGQLTGRKSSIFVGSLWIVCSRVKCRHIYINFSNFYVCWNKDMFTRSNMQGTVGCRCFDIYVIIYARLNSIIPTFSHTHILLIIYLYVSIVLYLFYIVECFRIRNIVLHNEKIDIFLIRLCLNKLFIHFHSYKQNYTIF